MALEVREVEVGGFTYTINQLPGRSGLLLFYRLAAKIGPSLAVLLGDALEGGGLSSMNVGALAMASREAFDRLPEAEFDAIAQRLLSTVSVVVDGRRMDLTNLKFWDVHFMGRTFDLFKLLQISLEVNYGSFTDALAVVAKSAGAAAGSSAESSTSPTNG